MGNTLTILLLASLLATHAPHSGTAAAPPMAAAVAPSGDSVSDLPLHPVSAGNGPWHTMAVFLTGDGGWAPFDERVCADLAAAGMPTIALDTGDYFSRLRTPDEAARALARTVRHGLAEFGAERVTLIGYSFGADVMPFLLARLPEELQAKVDRVALMSPGPIAPFQVTAAERIGLDSPGGRPTVPALAEVSSAKADIRCLYGEGDPDAICPGLRLPGTTPIRLPGGHGFGDDHARVAEAILVQRASGSAEGP